MIRASRDIAGKYSSSARHRDAPLGRNNVCCQCKYALCKLTGPPVGSINLSISLTVINFHLEVHKDGLLCKTTVHLSAWSRRWDNGSNSGKVSKNRWKEQTKSLWHKPKLMHMNTRTHLKGKSEERTPEEAGRDVMLVCSGTGSQVASWEFPTRNHNPGLKSSC